MITTKFEWIELFGDSTFATSDGKTISFTESLLKADLEIDVHARDASEDLPTDVLAASLFVADSDGAVWRVSSRVSCGSIISLMGDVRTVDSHLVSDDTADADLKECFKSKVITNLRYSSDDRFYRNILIDGQPRQFQFHYTTITFDLALYEGSGVADPRVAVFVRPNSLFDDEGDSLPGFYFLAYWERLFQANTAVFSEEYQSWRDDPLPRPLIFEPAGRHATPNTGVTTS